MRQIRSVLVTLILLAVTIRILFWAIEPIIPYLIAALFIVFIMGFFIFRKLFW